MKTLLITLILLTSSAYGKCTMTKIQKTPPKVEEVELCFGDKPNLYMTKGGDLGKHTKRKIDIHPASSNAAAEACKQLGGTVEMIKILIKEKWVDSDRCVFQDTTPFSVSGALLMKTLFP